MAYANPTLSRRIFFQNASRLSSDDDRYKMTDDGTLKIYNVEVEDSAKYVCRADNKYGLPVIASAFVTVRTK